MPTASPTWPVGKLIQRGNPGMTAAEAAAYDAPFPDVRYKAGVRRFPNLVPDHDDAPGAAISRAAAALLEASSGRATASWPIGMMDPVLGPAAMQRAASG